MSLIKLKYIILALAVISLILAGCGEKSADNNVVEKLPSEVAEEDKETLEDLEGLSTKEMLEKLQGKTSTDTAPETTDIETEDSADTNATEETPDTNTTTPSEVSTNSVSISNFKATPADLDIKVGSTVTWKNQMENFKQIIVIYQFIETEGKYSNTPINPKEEILLDEEYSYTFDKAGKYKWGSLTKFDKIVGIITVTE